MAVEVRRRREDRRRALRPRAGGDRRRAARHPARRPVQPADARDPLELAQGPRRQGAQEARRPARPRVADASSSRPSSAPTPPTTRPRPPPASSSAPSASRPSPRRRRRRRRRARRGPRRRRVVGAARWRADSPPDGGTPWRACGWRGIGPPAGRAPSPKGAHDGPSLQPQAAHRRGARRPPQGRPRAHRAGRPRAADHRGLAALDQGPRQQRPLQVLGLATRC